MKRTKEEAAETRELLIKSALEVCSHKGYAATTLNDIAKNAGTTRGAIQWHFENKNNLYRIIGERATNQVDSFIEKTINSESTPINQIRTMIQSFYRIFFENDEFQSIVRLAMRAKLTNELTDLENIYKNSIIKRKNLISNLIRAGIDNNQIISTLDPDITASAIISYMAGTINSWISNPSLFPLRQNVETYVALIINGLKTGSNKG